MNRRHTLLALVLLTGCQTTSTPVPSTLPGQEQGMVKIAGGTFRMGSDDPRFPDSQPVHKVSVDSFWMDKYPVTNAQFEKFVAATNYKTIAERPLDPKEFPGVPLDKLVPGAVVFTPPDHAVPLDDVTQWWSYVPKADWRHPEGPTSDLKGRESHPVVQVAYEDAAAYAKWAGKRLPTEAEWELAARGGLDQKPFVWGEDFAPGGKQLANTFNGDFPNKNTKADGYERTSPVGSFPPNAFGLYDMAGNVWQWCSDWYRPDYFSQSPEKNPQGPEDSLYPDEPGVQKRVHKGGSFLCCEAYCARYMPGGRGKGDINTGSSHVGFRCVK